MEWKVLLLLNYLPARILHCLGALKEGTWFNPQDEPCYRNVITVSGSTLIQLTDICIVQYVPILEHLRCFGFFHAVCLCLQTGAAPVGVRVHRDEDRGTGGADGNSVWVVPVPQRVSGNLHREKHTQGGTIKTLELVGWGRLKPV